MHEDANAATRTARPSIVILKALDESSRGSETHANLGDACSWPRKKRVCDGLRGLEPGHRRRRIA